MRFCPSLFLTPQSGAARCGAYLTTRSTLLVIGLLVFGLAQVASAQAPAASSEPPLVTLDAASAGAAPAPGANAGVTADKVDLSVLTKELLALEQQTLQLETRRAAVRTTGYRVGKIVSWSASAVFLLTAFSWYGQAQGIEKAIKDGRDDEAYDVNGNDKVTKHDEDVARTVARTMAITSLIPIGLGVFTTIFELRREREKRRLSNEIDDLSVRRRTLLRRLDGQVSASQVHASLSLRMRF